MGKLDKRVAIITGGGTGIGRTIALQFAKEGADVVVSSRNMANLEKVTEEIKAWGRRSLPIATDVRVKEQVQSMVKRTIDEFGKIDILVNNSGIMRRAVLLDMTEEVWDDVLNTNLKSVYLYTQAVTKYMIEQKYGKIINMASMSGRGWNYPGLAGYAASKAGVIELTKCYAKELGPYGINVNAIAPGFIETTMYKTGRTQEQYEKAAEDSRKATILDRLGTTQDVAHLALFFALDASSFICGETIAITGRRTDLM